MSKHNVPNTKHWNWINPFRTFISQRAKKHNVELDIELCVSGIKYIIDTRTDSAQFLF